ncbi:3-isopropylmalate dehydratase small subunit [Sphingomonas radiodurans]|uniref:3-isopropylmalate dehydratase small subunit n=1 Tax=Sphingomonas radiodurans TaxID=2890321 RepID=UPI001E3596BE|nr:3-isopropylmalate dehydratase small subunit [Sphingomonas radiodurans]WBH18026.1 3-isopropylmalate dehydratase small subunit [Sphingomonas radiodurans]
MTAFPPVPRAEGVAAPLLRANVDTDAIIPSREIKGVGKTGLADGLFAAWRYTDPVARVADPGFVLNDPRYAHAPILLTGENFGCGSSREHAVWALHEYGVRAVIAPSFAPIFRGNCIRNGIIPVMLAEPIVRAIAAAEGLIAVDLIARRVEAGDASYPFEIDAEARAMLAEGLDGIDLTMRHRDAIAAFHAADRAARPWIYLRPQP